jgi:hypothetical protein
MKTAFKWIGWGLLGLIALAVLSSASEGQNGHWVGLYVVLGVGVWQGLKIFEDYKRQTLQLLTRIEQQTYDLSQLSKAYSPVMEELLADSRKRESRPL